MTDLRILEADGSEEGNTLHTEEDVTVIPRDTDVIRIGWEDYEVVENGTFFVEVEDELRVTVTVEKIEYEEEEETDEVPTQ